MTRKELAQPTAVVPRESGGSSTPRFVHVIAEASGILDRPPSRATTAEVVTLSARLAMTRKELAQPTAVIPRESGDPVRRASSMSSPRSLEYWIARLRGRRQLRL